jgi:Trypsin
MKKVWGLLTVVFAALSVTAVAPAQTGDATIDGNSHPNVGGLLRQRTAAEGEFAGDYTVTCSGTLISPQIFLTAGHCADFLYSLNQKTTWVTFKPDWGYDRAGGPRITDPSTQPLTYHGTVVQNPAWHVPYQNDVAAVYLDAPVTAIAPAALAPIGLLDELKRSRAIYDTPFLNVGYGSSEQLVVPTVGPTFPFDGVRRWTISSFFALDPEYVHLNQNQTLGYSGTGYGDSGGPTFVDTPNGAGIVSVVSTGDIACFATSVNQRVDIKSARDFIAQVPELAEQVLGQ